MKRNKNQTLIKLIYRVYYTGALKLFSLRFFFEIIQFADNNFAITMPL